VVNDGTLMGNPIGFAEDDWEIYRKSMGNPILRGKSNTWGIDEGNMFFYFLVVPEANPCIAKDDD
jgi:hypothetical protein